ncbi:MAG TPA: carbamate kinase [Phycisphaerae bacterium]|nr:carbamate kinase [Phycisphaerae bacterium]HRW55631.1 carbamate kinase [Phycisphaerae bacterium]
MRVVVAIGGNALVEASGDGTIPAQFRCSRVVARPLSDLVEAGWQVVVTHGNGPQVGSVMRRVELSSKEIYPIDLGLAVADTQGGMGYMICQTWRNELRRRGHNRAVTAVITTVTIDPKDPGFVHPTKPIGGFMDEQTARGHERDDGWKIVEDSGRGFRRVVASPRPKSVNEMPTIKALVDAGALVVAGGGGGIPVIHDENGDEQGVEAVIDKDLTSAIIAAETAADVFVLVTAVEHVFVDFGKPTARPLKDVSMEEIQRHIVDKQFPAGSMLPKVEAAIEYLNTAKNPNARAVITDLFNVPRALAGETGTTIRK